MDPMTLSVAVVSRLLHVLAAVLLLGGGVFKLLVVLPVATGLPEVERAALREKFLKRWRYLVASGIAILIVTGFYNYLVVAAPQADGRYHMLMGIKILLAFAVFFLASALAGRSAALERIRANAKLWMGVSVVLSVIVVGIASFLKIRGSS